MKTNLDRAILTRKRAGICFLGAIGLALLTVSFGFYPRFMAMYGPKEPSPEEYVRVFVQDFIARHQKATQLPTLEVADEKSFAFLQQKGKLVQSELFKKLQRQDSSSLYPSMLSWKGATLFYMMDHRELRPSYVDVAGKPTLAPPYKTLDFFMFDVLAAEALPDIVKAVPEATFTLQQLRLVSGNGLVGGKNLILVSALWIRLYSNYPPLDAGSLSRLSWRSEEYPTLEFVDPLYAKMASGGLIRAHDAGVYEDIRYRLFAPFYWTVAVIRFGGLLAVFAFVVAALFCLYRARALYVLDINTKVSELSDQYCVELSGLPSHLLWFWYKGPGYLREVHQRRLIELSGIESVQLKLQKQEWKLAMARLRVQDLLDRLDATLYPDEARTLRALLDNGSSVSELDSAFNICCCTLKRARFVLQPVNGNGASGRIKKDDLTVLLDRFLALPVSHIQPKALELYLKVLADKDMGYAEALSLLQEADGLQKAKTSTGTNDLPSNGKAVDNFNFDRKNLAERVLPFELLSRHIPSHLDTGMVWEILVASLRLGMPVKRLLPERMLRNQAIERWKKREGTVGDGIEAFDAALAWLVSVGAVEEYTEHSSQGKAYFAVTVPGKGMPQGAPIISMLKNARDVSVKGFVFTAQHQTQAA